MLVTLLLVAQQDPRRPDQWALPWDGLDAFVMTLGKCGIQLRAAHELRQLDEPSNTLVILLGEAPRDIQIDQLIIKFNASVLIASDHPSMKRWFDHYQVEYVKGPILVQPKDGFDQATDCPKVRGAIDHPVFENVGRVALNRAAGFTWVDSRTLAPFQDQDGKTYGWLAERKSGPFGPRVMLLSDHSLFINLMMSELDNALFAENLLRYFGVENACLYLNGRLVRFEQFPWSSSQTPDLGTALAMAGPALRGLETSGILQDFAEKNAALAIGMATIILGAIGALGVIRARSRPVAALETTGPLLPDMASDDAASARKPDYHVAARELLRRWWRHGRQTRDLPSIEAFAEGRFSFEAGTPMLKRWMWRYQLKRIARMTLRPPRRLHLAGYQGLAAALGRLDALGRIR